MATSPDWDLTVAIVYDRLLFTRDDPVMYVIDVELELGDTVHLHTNERFIVIHFYEELEYPTV